MSKSKVQEVYINLEIFKWCRFHHMFNPESTKILNWNVYQLFFILFGFTVQCLMVFGTLGYFVKMEDTVNEIDFLVYLVIYIQNVFVSLKMVICFYHANTILEVFEVTRLNFLKSKQCHEHIKILEKCHDKTRKRTKYYLTMYFVTFFQFIMFPIYVNSLILSDNGNHRYHSPINMRYPVTIKTYNENFWLFYAIEIYLGIFFTYILMMIDLLLMTLCWVITAQYKVLGRAFANIGHKNKYQNENKYNCTEYYEDFKSVLIDQQQLYLKVKSYYSYSRPILLLQVAFTSVSIIIFTYALILVSSTMKSISIINVFRLGFGTAYLYLQFFLYCYLFGEINYQRESINFAIYSCKWTEMNLMFKKLLLLSMRMNNANQITIKATPKKIIDLKLFTHVIMTSYNVVSVMLKTMNKKNE